VAELADHHPDHLGGFGALQGRLAGAAQFANLDARQFRQSLEQVSSWPGRIQQGAAHVVDHLGAGRQHLGHRGIPGRGNALGRAVSRGTGDRLAEVVDDELLDRLPDVVLGAVMMHQQPDRHVGRGGNRPHRGAVFALAGVQVERGVTDPGLSRQVLIACAGVQLRRHRHLHLLIGVRLYTCKVGYTNASLTIQLYSEMEIGMPASLRDVRVISSAVDLPGPFGTALLIAGCGVPADPLREPERRSRATACRPSAGSDRTVSTAVIERQ